MLFNTTFAQHAPVPWLALLTGTLTIGQRNAIAHRFTGPLERLCLVILAWIPHERALYWRTVTDDGQARLHVPLSQTLQRTAMYASTVFWTSICAFVLMGSVTWMAAAQAAAKAGVPTSVEFLHEDRIEWALQQEPLTLNANASITVVYGQDIYHDALGQLLVQERKGRPCVGGANVGVPVRMAALNVRNAWWALWECPDVIMNPHILTNDDGGPMVVDVQTVDGGLRMTRCEITDAEVAECLHLLKILNKK